MTEQNISAEFELQRVISLCSEERSELEKIAKDAVNQPLIRGEEFYPNHKLETPERRNVFVKHYLDLARHANSFYDYLIRAGGKIIGYAAIDKGYDSLKNFFPVSVHFAFVSPALTPYVRTIEDTLSEECKKIELSNKKEKLQILF